MNHSNGGYGLWSLVFINSAIFILFAYSFFKPKGKRDWRTFSTYSAFILLSASWRKLYIAQTNQVFATTGPYGVVRHPQYIAFVIIMFGFLMQWPTILTVPMFPVLVIMYLRLANHEERDIRKIFGPQWDAYAAKTPAFFPRFGSSNEQKTAIGKPA